MMNSFNLNSIKIACPSCSGEAKYLKPLFNKAMKRKVIEGYIFKCRNCQCEFIVNSLI